ncbi:hypothetical protein SKAU_G00302910 [Synaphobranchus kaupii]|uniref:Uncharacterized protein n=1 Tax=Synaphobranchus kaupii TaxID=118154 RepID=A0A9Q1EW21_SYNKA|nr:hypothetical protein SKAU_G00302910 [Synaphobranchus kaupii]
MLRPAVAMAMPCAPARRHGDPRGGTTGAVRQPRLCAAGDHGGVGNLTPVDRSPARSVRFNPSSER